MPFQDTLEVFPCTHNSKENSKSSFSHPPRHNVPHTRIIQKKIASSSMKDGPCLVQTSSVHNSKENSKRFFERYSVRQTLHHFDKIQKKIASCHGMVDWTGEKQRTRQGNIQKKIASQHMLGLDDSKPLTLEQHSKENSKSPT